MKRCVFEIKFFVFDFQVLQRIDDVSLMCDKRIATLKKLTIKPPPKPVQTVTPEPAVPLQPPIGAPHLRKRNKVSVFSFFYLYTEQKKTVLNISFLIKF